MEKGCGLCFGWQAAAIIVLSAIILLHGILMADWFFDEQAKEELFEELKKDYVSGVTFSGGDPFHLENREEIGALAKEIREKFPDKTIWLYTGYEWEEICHLSFLSNIDVIVDGKFKIEEKDNNLHWKGSANQRVIDVKASLRAGEVRLYQE